MRFTPGKVDCTAKHRKHNDPDTAHANCIILNTFPGDPGCEVHPHPGIPNQPDPGISFYLSQELPAIFFAHRSLNIPNYMKGATFLLLVSLE